MTDHPAQAHERILCSDLHPKYPLLALGCETSRIKVWSVRAQIYVALLPHIGKIFSVQWSPCGQFLATAGSSERDEAYTINIWTLQSTDSNFAVAKFRLHAVDGALKYTLNMNLHSDIVTSVAFLPAGDRGECSIVASGSIDQTVRLWDFSDHDSKRIIFRDHTGPVTKVSFSYDGRFLASASHDNSVCLWIKEVHENNFNFVAKYPLGYGQPGFDCCFFPMWQQSLDYREYLLAIGTSANMLVLSVRNNNLKTVQSGDEYPAVLQELAKDNMDKNREFWKDEVFQEYGDVATGDGDVLDDAAEVVDELIDSFALTPEERAAQDKLEAEQKQKDLVKKRQEKLKQIQRNEADIESDKDDSDNESQIHELDQELTLGNAVVLNLVCRTPGEARALAVGRMKVLCARKTDRDSAFQSDREIISFFVAIAGGTPAEYDRFEHASTSLVDKKTKHVPRKAPFTVVVLSEKLKVHTKDPPGSIPYPIWKAHETKLSSIKMQPVTGVSVPSAFMSKWFIEQGFCNPQEALILGTQSQTLQVMKWKCEEESDRPRRFFASATNEGKPIISVSHPLTRYQSNRLLQMDTLREQLKGGLIALRRGQLLAQTLGGENVYTIETNKEVNDGKIRDWTEDKHDADDEEVDDDTLLDDDDPFTQLLRERVKGAAIAPGGSGQGGTVDLQTSDDTGVFVMYQTMADDEERPQNTRACSTQDGCCTM